MKNNIYNRYFIFSRKTKEERTTIAKKAGRTYTPGTVVANGIKKEYTDILVDMSKAPADAVIVVKGDIRNINYTKESSKKI